MKTIAIYHKDCADGTTSAAVVLRKYPDASAFPLGHGHEPEDIQKILETAVPGDRIFTVDCAIGAKEFLAAGFPVTVIDHHAGAEDYLDDMAKTDKNLTYVFDNEKSGASLAWAHFFPGEETPELIRLVEDKDIWKWKFGDDTKDANNYIDAFCLNKPEEVVKLLEGGVSDIKKAGRAISRYTDTMIERGVEKVDPISVRVGTHSVLFYNLTVFKSESGNMLSTLKNQAVALFSIDGENVKISFRCLDGHTPSALELAKALGGGGHRNAAGAAIKLADFIRAIEL